jgi:light-regulated signal transduction histidine kinase (bacteriophytochrome)
MAGKQHLHGKLVAGRDALNQENVNVGPGGQLTPRASFDAWSETVRGRAQRWTILEVEAAGRLRLAVMGVWQNRRIRDLNRQPSRPSTRKSC